MSSSDPSTKKGKKKRSNKNKEEKSNTDKTKNDYLKNVNGKIYENIASAKLFKDFYIEDMSLEFEKIIANFEVDFDTLKKELAPFLIISFNNEKDEEQNQILEVVSEISKYLSGFSLQNKYLVEQSMQEAKSDVTDSSMTSEEELKLKRVNLKKLEIDYILKSVLGKNISNYLRKNKNHFEFVEGFKISDEERYNVCCEITLNNNNIIRYKFFQLYKYLCWINLFYDIHKSINKIKGTINQVFIPLKNKIKSNYDFINCDCKTILIMVANGKKEDFDLLKCKIESSKKKYPLISHFYEECLNKTKVIFQFYSFDYNNNQDNTNEIDALREQLKKCESEKDEYYQELEKFKKKNIGNMIDNLGAESKSMGYFDKIIEIYKEDKLKLETKLEEYKKEKDNERAELQKKMVNERKEFEKKIVNEKREFEKKIDEFHKKIEEYQAKIEEYRKMLDEEQNKNTELKIVKLKISVLEEIMKEKKIKIPYSEE